MALSFVENHEQIRASVEEFCWQAFSDLPLARELARQVTYWIYDPYTGNYGPSKFVGFVGMTFEDYREARREDPPEFDGARTRQAIENATGLSFAQDEACTRGLPLWADEMLGAGTLDGVNPDRWRFLRLTASCVLPNEYRPDPALPPHIKTVGVSQIQDGVRIEKRFHDLFNPPDSNVYVPRGSRRDVSIFFNGKVFDAHYVYEGTSDQGRTMQRFQFKSDLMGEFEKTFPDLNGQFTIQAGRDLNHFLFRIRMASGSHYAEDLERRVVQSRRDNQAERLTRLQSAPKKPATVQVTSTAFVRNPDVIAEALIRAAGKCEECGKDAPFLRASDGSPYLEVHHRVPLAQGGEDTVDNALSLCPNCHRQAHYG